MMGDLDRGDQEFVGRAVQYLRDNIKPDVLAQLPKGDEETMRNFIHKKGLHFGFGMGVRNLLRQGGFGDEYWVMDDVYIPLLTRAVNP